MTPIRFVSFLAPCLHPMYEFIARHAAVRLGQPTELCLGDGYDQLAEADVAFVCGLPYVLAVRNGVQPIEPLAAPVLRGARYGGRPIYFSDIIVRHDRPYRTFAELRGRSWAFNEPYSQSGYGITRHRLLELGETRGYFSRVVEAGWHEEAIRLVMEGEVEASAIDSHVLAVVLRQHPEWVERLRLIESLGPSPIQPVVASRRLAESLRGDLRAVLLGMADDPEAREPLDRALVERFAPASDSDYDPIRRMLARAEERGFLTLR